MARPCKLTPEVQEIIVKAIGLGASYSDAAQAAGVDYMTFNNWMKAGESAKSGKFFKFFEAVRKEEAAAALRHLAVINNAAAKGDWKASLEWLRRRRRQDWGDSVDVTTGGERTNKITVEYVDSASEVTQSADSDQDEPQEV